MSQAARLAQSEISLPSYAALTERSAGWKLDSGLENPLRESGVSRM